MKTCRLTAVLAMALAASQSAWSINKCTGPDGKVSFQDSPCSSGKSEQVKVQSAPTDDDAAAEDTRRPGLSLRSMREPESNRRIRVTIPFSPGSLPRKRCPQQDDRGGTRALPS
jgi:hypothetical protein